MKTDIQLMISRPVRPKMRNVSDKSCSENNQNTQFMFNNVLPTIGPSMR